MDLRLTGVIERVAARNLLDYAGQSSIPCAGGAAAFLGADSPLTTVKGAGPDILDADFAEAERFLRERGAERIVFEIAPWISTDTVRRLRTRGYTELGSEDVVVQHSPFELVQPAHTVKDVSAAEWPNLMVSMNGATRAEPWAPLAEIAAVLPNVLQIVACDSSGLPISCAQLAPVGHVAIFGNDATLPSARGQGAQTSTIRHRLRAAYDQGFHLAIAEVAPGSTSERNYIRCGFQIAYTRTFYTL